MTPQKCHVTLAERIAIDEAKGRWRGGPPAFCAVTLNHGGIVTRLTQKVKKRTTSIWYQELPIMNTMGYSTRPGNIQQRFA